MSADFSIGYFMVLIVGFGLWIAYDTAISNSALVVPNAVALVVALPRSGSRPLTAPDRRPQEITSTAALGFVLRLSFDDGTTREVDVDELLQDSVFEPLGKDPELFRQVRVEGGTTVPSGADIDPVVLHGSAEPAWKEQDRGSRRTG